MGYSTYLKIDGLVGDCAEEAHRGWHAVDSFSHAVTGQQTTQGGPHLGELSIAKFVDRATPLFARATAEGRLFREALLELCRTDGTRVRFMALKMSNVRVSMHSLTGGTQGDQRTPYENLCLSFEKIEWLYYPSAFEPKAESEAEVRTSWSVQSAKATA